MPRKTYADLFRLGSSHCDITVNIKERPAGQSAERMRQFSAYRGMMSSEMYHVSVEIKEVLIFVKISPVEPRYLIILTVGIVIPELSVRKLVTCENHGRASAAHDYRDGISHQAESQIKYLGIVRIALHTAVP